MVDFNHAASKIQAAFKGYKERKILKEANILPKDLVAIKKFFRLETPEAGFVISRTTRTPERLYDAPSKYAKKTSIENKCPYTPPTPVQQPLLTPTQVRYC